MLFMFFDRDFFASLFNPSFIKPVTTEETTIVDTATEAETKPLTGMISDKANVNSAPKQGENRYNYVNPDMEQSPYQKSVSGKTVKDSSRKSASGEDSVQLDTIKGNPEASTTGGDYHTSYFDPQSPPDVEMDNNGDMSLATIPEAFASYFLAMEKKVGENWQKFFPIFQFYQGLIKSGDVVVTFWVDDKGNILNPTVIKSYGYSILDEAFLNAVIYSKNFGPLPVSVNKGRPVKVDFKFIYLSR
jgi:TonB family protein